MIARSKREIHEEFSELLESGYDITLRDIQDRLEELATASDATAQKPHNSRDKTSREE